MKGLVFEDAPTTTLILRQLVRLQKRAPSSVALSTGLLLLFVNSHASFLIHHRLNPDITPLSPTDSAGMFITANSTYRRREPTVSSSIRGKFGGRRGADLEDANTS